MARLLDQSALARSLARDGYGLTAPLLTPAQCKTLRALFFEDARFRSTVHMAPRHYGAGVYRYFRAPLPRLVGALRRRLYAELVPLANDWQAQLKKRARFPRTLDEFLARCHRAGQKRPTPLLLRYEVGGHNRLHQDVYGALAFPLQATLLLSDPARDFEGGEFLLTEHRARGQARGRALRLARGQAVVFANAAWPAPGARGVVRAIMRHGVSDITRGERIALGLIFHDAK